MKRIFGLLSLAAMCAPVHAQDANPVLGTWDWNPTQGNCHEVHTYRSDGTAQTRSGTEVLEKTCTISPASGGTYRVIAQVVSSNGGKDCLGSTTPSGSASTVYIQPLNFGSYLTCASEDGMSCYGTARRMVPRTDR